MGNYKYGLRKAIWVVYYYAKGMDTAKACYFDKIEDAEYFSDTVKGTSRVEFSGLVEDTRAIEMVKKSSDFVLNLMGGENDNA